MALGNIVLLDCEVQYDQIVYQIFEHQIPDDFRGLKQNVKKLTCESRRVED